MAEEWEEDGFIEEVVVTKKFDDEKEEVERKKLEPKVEKPKEADLNDYEFKYQQKHKDDIAEKKELEQALEGMDEKKKAEFLEERRKMKDLEDFSCDKIDKKKVTKNQKLLENEADFQKLGVTVAAKLNKNPKTPLKYKAVFLKETMDHLGSLLDLKTINDMIRDLTKIFNDKRNKESGKKPSQKNKKPKIAAGKGIDTSGKRQPTDDNGEDLEEDFEDEYYMK